MTMNFNDAKPQSGGTGEIIPDNTVAPVRMNMRGEKTTKAGDARMLDCEFVITEGPFAKRRIWSMMMITSNGSAGHDTAVDITRSRVRGMLESAFGIDPSDDSPAGMAARQISDWSDLDGLEFVARIGIEKDKTGSYPDKNAIKAAVTPDSEDYAGFKPAKPKVGGMASNQAAQKPANGASRPSWAV